jgi:hypothetical protein
VVSHPPILDQVLVASDQRGDLGSSACVSRQRPVTQGSGRGARRGQADECHARPLTPATRRVSLGPGRPAESGGPSSIWPDAGRTWSCWVVASSSVVSGPGSARAMRSTLLDARLSPGSSWMLAPFSPRSPRVRPSARRRLVWVRNTASAAPKLVGTCLVAQECVAHAMAFPVNQMAHGVAEKNCAHATLRSACLRRMGGWR